MTNEEAIVVLQKIKPIPHRGDGKSITHTLEIIAVDKAIKALEQQPCEDCVSRQAVLDIINFEYEWLLDAIIYDINTSIAFSSINAKIKALPSVQPIRTTGKWETFVEDYNKCSKCGEMGKFYRIYKYCPNCGAKMEVEE